MIKENVSPSPIDFTSMLCNFIVILFIYVEVISRLINCDDVLFTSYLLTGSSLWCSQG